MQIKVCLAPSRRLKLLATSNDIIYRKLQLFITAVHTQAFGRHGIETIDGVLVKCIVALGDAINPGARVPVFGGAAGTRAMTGGASGIVYIFSCARLAATGRRCRSNCPGSTTIFALDTDLTHGLYALGDGVRDGVSHSVN
jgi:hypothetical protein